MTRTTALLGRGATALIVVACGLTACGSDSESNAADTTTEAVADTTVETTVDETTGDPASVTQPDTTTAGDGAGAVEGSDLVCAAVAGALQVADDSGWGPGTGAEDEVAKAAISAQMVIGTTLDDPDSMGRLWESVDDIAASECPADADRLVAIYGSTSLADILAAR